MPSNVRMICAAVNIALNDFGEEMLIHIARELLRFRRFAKSDLRNIPQYSENAIIKSVGAIAEI